MNYGKNKALFLFLLTLGLLSQSAIAVNVTNTYPSSQEFNISTTISINATVSDPDGISSVLANITFPNSTTQLLILSNTSLNSYNASFTIPKAVGEFNITFIANDTLNNFNDTEKTNFTSSIINPTSLHGLRSWYDASDNSTLFTDEACTSQVTASGQDVSCWSDKSSYSANASNVSGKGIPTFITDEFNGRSVLNFSKSETDTLRHIVPSQYTSNFTIFLVIQSKGNAATFDSFFSNGEPASTDHFQIDYTNSSGENSFRYGASAKFNFETYSNEIKLYSVTHNGTDVALFNEGEEVNNGSTTEGQIFEHYRINQNRNGNQHHDSKIGEIILYDKALTACEREQVNVHLGGKYGRDFFGLSDNYDFGSPHNNDINGIGEFESTCSSSKTFTLALSSIATVQDPTELNLNDSLTFAHDNSGFSLITEAPTGYDTRINQSWRVDEDNDVGNVSLSFDLSSTGISTASSEFALLIDSNTNFTDATIHLLGYSVTDNTVTFTTINFSDGEYFTLAVNEKPPSISFIDPTLTDLALHNEDSFVINITSSSFGDDHYTLTDLDNSLVLWLRMDDVNSSQDPTDISSYSSNATLENGATINSTGKFGDAVHLDGVNAYINLNETNIDFTNGFSACVWTYWNSFTESWSRILDLGQGQADDNILFAHEGTTTDLIFEVYNGATGGNKIEAASILLSDTWQHLCVSENSTGYTELYVNGSQVANGTANVPSNVNRNSAYIGRSNWGSDGYFNGAIDELLIFNRSLDSSEILSIYNASSNQYSHTFTSLNEGNHTFISHTVSINGKKNQTETRTVTIETIPPNGTLLSPSNNTVTNTLEHNLTINASDNYALSNVTLNIYNESNDLINQTTTETSGTESFIGTIYNFIEGVFVWFYRVVDAANNIFNTENNTITIDQTPPEVTSQIPESGSLEKLSSTIEISVNVSDTIQVDTVLANITYPGNNTLLTLSLATGTKYNVSLTLDSVVGRYNITFIANDTAGNVNDSEISYFITNFTDPTSLFGTQLWLDSTDNSTLYNDISCATLISSDNEEVKCWLDKSGKANNATVFSDKAGARYAADTEERINGLTTLRFNKTNETVYETPFDIRANVTEDISLFAVYRPKTNTTTDQGQGLWGNDDGSWDRFYYSLFSENAGVGTDGIDDGLISLGGASSGLSIDGAGIVDNTFLLTAIYDGNVSSGTNSGPVNASQIYFDGTLTKIFTDESHATAAKTNLFIGWDGDNGVYDGELAEVIVYDRIVDACEIERINNYLGEKYGKDFSNVDDRYDYSANFSQDINGVGIFLPSQCTPVPLTNQAASNILTISDPTNVDDNDTLTFGHDSGNLTIISETNNTLESYNRIQQVWRADIDDQGSGHGVGNVTVSFDFSTNTTFLNYNNFALLIETNNNFSNATILTSSWEKTGNTILFNNISFTDGDYFTIGFNDTEPPNGTPLSPENNSYVNNATQNLTLNASDNIALLNATLSIYNDTALINQTTISVSGTEAVIGIVYEFVEGVFTWFYQIFDTASNLFTTNNSTLTVDLTPPSVVGLIPTNATNHFEGNSIEISANVSDIFEVDTVLANITLPNSTVNAITLTNSIDTKYNSSYTLPINGTYTIFIIANDTAGNVNDSESTTLTATSAPLIEFLDPTLADLTLHNQNNFEININSTAFNEDHYTFVNFDNSLLMWMRMDDVNSSGDPVDASGNGNNGTLEGDALINSTGLFGDAAHFDGNGDFINLPSSNSLVENQAAWTISMWFNANSISSESLGNRMITLRNSSTLSATALTLGNSNILQFFYRNTTGTGKTIDVRAISTNSWYHYAVTYNGSASKVYVNGALNTTIVDTITGASTHTARIAANPSGSSQFFNGSIDELLILNHQLSDQEISSLYNATANQYNTTTTTLSEGNHSFTGYAVSTNGKKNQTETRTVTIDTSTPNVTALNANPSQTYNLTAQINISLNTSDNFELDTVLVNITFPNSTVVQLTLIQNTENQYNNTFNSPGLVGNYTIAAIVNDTAGNINSSETTTFEIQAAIPSPSSVSINEGNDITLSSGSNTTIVGEATITDLNGYPDISTVTGYLFQTNIGLGTDNRSNHYTSSCTHNGDGSGNTISYNCTFNVSHYATPTDSGSNQSITNWTFLISPTDSAGLSANDTDVVEINTLLAFDINPNLIEFGALNLGENTTDTNQEINVTNNGNVHLDIILSGTNLSCGPGVIPVNFLEYEDNPFTYGVGVDLLESGIELNLDALAGNQNSELPLRPTYYGLGSPQTSVGGSCTGTIIITAQSDPHKD